MMSSVILFALAALGGLVLAYLHLKKNGAPLGLAVLHGILAVAGLVLLLVFMSQGHAAGFLMGAVILFVLAALGGLFLFTLHIKTRPLPSAIIVLHAVIAVSGFLTLLIGMTKNPM